MFRKKQNNNFWFLVFFFVADTGEGPMASFVSDPFRLSFGPADQITGPPCRSPLLNINLALGLGHPERAIMAAPQQPQTSSPTIRRRVPSSIMADDSARKMLEEASRAFNGSRTDPLGLNVSIQNSSSPFLRPSSLSAVPTAASYAAMARPVGNETARFGMNFGAFGSNEGCHSPSKRGKFDEDADKIVSLGDSAIFIANENKTRNLQVAKRVLDGMERRHNFWKAQANAMQSATGVLPNCDFAKANEFLGLDVCRSPKNDVPSPNFDLSQEKPVILILGDSTVCAGQVTEPGNTYLATFYVDKNSGQISVGPLSYTQVDLTALGKGLPYDLVVFGISGLSLVHGENRFTAKGLKEKVYEAFDLDPGFRFTEVLTCIGTNDVKAIAQKAETMTSADVMGQEGQSLPLKVKDLYDQVAEGHKGLARAFKCPVIWISAGCAMNVQSRGDGEAPFFRLFLEESAGQKKGPTVRFNEFLTAFVSYHLVKSDGELKPVDEPAGPGKFCSFATIPGVPSNSGTGHPAPKRLANWFANIINCAGITLCKVLNRNDACNVFISKSGLPPFWDRKAYSLYERKCSEARSRGEPLPEPVAFLTPTKHTHLEYFPGDSAKLVNKLVLRKQHEFTQVGVTDEYSHPIVSKDNVLFYHRQHPFVPGQVCRIKLGFKGTRNEERYEAALVLFVTEKVYVCSSLWNNEVHLVPKDRIACSKHMYLPMEWDWLRTSQI